MSATVWTYIGQIVNFIVFVVILYYLLYRPVGRILKERKDAMEADLREAEKLRAEADQAGAEAEKHEQELEGKREGILKEAHDQADKLRKEIIEKAETEARARLDRFRRVLKQERDGLLDKITEELRETILHVAGAVIGDDADRLTDHSIARVEALLKDMSDEELDAAHKALAGEDAAAQVRSAGPLNQEQQKRLKKLLAEKLGVEQIELEVEQDASLLAGIEVTLSHINLSAHWRGLIDEALRKNREGLQAPEEGPGSSQ